MAAIQWCGSCYFLASRCQTRGEEVKVIQSKRKRRLKMDMVSTISFIQANLQHSIAVSTVTCRTVCVKGIYVATVVS